MHTRLKTVLNLRKITYEDLAKSTGLSKKTIVSAANGGNVTDANRRLIALTLGDSKDELFRIENIPACINEHQGERA